MLTAHCSTAVVALALTISTNCINAYPRFVSRVPNAQAISGVKALGHRNSAGGGALNAFGEAFKAQNTQWTTALCHEDSDGDGATNGEELGDPCCKWTEASSGQLGSQMSHPGVPNAWTPTQLEAMKCKEDFSPEATTTDATSAAAAATSAPPVPATAESPLRARPRTATVGVDGSASTDGSDDDDDLPSTVDPNGLRETPPSLMPQTPAPISKPKAKTATPTLTPTPTPAKSGSSTGADQHVALGIIVAAFLAIGVAL